MKNLNVLYQSDDNYAIYMGVSIVSLLENNKEHKGEINVFIIDDSIADDNKSKLEILVNSYNRCKLFFLDGESILQDKEITEAFFYTGNRKNTHSYLKLFLDNLLPQVNGRIIYLDCDTAVTGTIAPLLDIDMQGNPIGMVKDSLVTKSKLSVGLNETDNYYNSGVILIDLDIWRKKQCSKRILKHVKEVGTYGTVDQDILNVEFKGEIITLPPEYNLQPLHLEYSYQNYTKVYRHLDDYYNRKELEYAVENPAIIHYLRYLGESPWHRDSLHPGTGYFDKYLSLTPWNDYEKKPPGKSFIFGVEKWLYRKLPRNIFLRLFHMVHEIVIWNSNRR